MMAVEQHRPGPKLRTAPDTSAAERGRDVHPQDTTTPTDVPVLELVEPMPGFPDQRQFTLVRLDDDGLVCALRAIDDSGLRFLVVPPAAFFAGYAPEVDEQTAQTLEAASAEDLLVLVVVSTAGEAQSATANLRAPIVVNHRTRKATQVVLPDDSLPMRAPLVPEAPAEHRSTQRVR